MSSSKLKKIPFKIISGYLIILIIILSAGWKLYTENALFFKIEENKTFDESKLTTLSSLQHKIAKVERFARNTIYSTQARDIIELNTKIDTLILEIAATKTQLKQFEEVVLLDTVSNLLLQKSSNVASLQNLRSKQETEKDVNFAIVNLKQLEEHYRKLKIEDFVKEPNKLGKYESKVITDFVEYMNQNIPDDSTNTISQKKMDSILVSSKNLLNQVKITTEAKRKAYEQEEKKLLRNEKAISEKIQKIFITVEEAIINKNTQSRVLKEESFQKLNNQISIYAIIALATTIFFIVLNIIDFIKTQRYKRELEKANDKANYLLKGREQLISTVSHDLKSPIAAIGGYGEILRKTSLNPKQEYYVDNIIKSSDYLTNLANDLASLTLIEAGKIKLENSPFSLNQLLVDTAQNIQAIYATKPINLIFDFDETLEKNIITDPYRVRQIATNLIGNAFKFTAKGNITIGTTLLANNQVLFYVKDTGIGIKKENLDVVFKEFTQADNTIEKRFGGTGLGLTISRKVAEILGGSIDLESEYGKGSCFLVTIKFLEIVENTAKKPEVASQFNFQHLKAVIVDDDQQILTLLKEILEKEHIIVYPFSNVADALDKINGIQPQFIFTDIQMPNQTGFDLVKQIRENNESSNIPVIALTGNTDAEKTKYQNAGFNALLSKPFSISSILNTIEKLIQNPDSFIVNNKHLDGKPLAYNLKSIAEFLNNDKKLIYDFLEKSKQNNLVYLNDLKQFYKTKDQQAIKGLAHKMASIFKQLEHKEITNLLVLIENETDFKVLKKQVSELEDKINSFFNEILQKMG
nr:ATP-binding protein [uncultured Flavobacterium sp.]